MPLQEPHLDLVWEPRGQNLVDSALVLLRGPLAPKKFRGGPYFRDCWISGAPPRRAFFASVLWHTALILLVIPLSKFVAVRSNPALSQAQITWYGPVSDLPAIAPRRPGAKPSPRARPANPLPPSGADAFHPRQTILNSPMRPSHPRQTLIQTAAPPEPPKILPSLPNIVAWNTPNSPRLHLDPAELARLLPKAPAVRAEPHDTSLPELPNQEQPLGAISIAPEAVTAQPLLPLSPMQAPHTNAARTAELGAPEIAAGNPTDTRLIALSAMPGPSMPLAVPPGNLSSVLAISPESTKPDASASGRTPVGNTSSGERSGTGPAGLSISVPRAAPSTITGAVQGGPTTPGMVSRPVADLLAAPPASLDRMRPGPLLERLKPGMLPEELLGTKQIYTLHVNMPNLTSATGSWVLNFADLVPLEGESASASQAPADLSGPEPLKKVDPKYPPELRGERVEGEVILYAVIRADGSVDSIQLVAGIDPTLDANAMQALARWKFRPAKREGAPVEIGAIIHIPFRAAVPAY